MFKIGWENNKILPWIKITNFVIRTFTPIIYQNSYPITVKGCEVTENIIGIHQFTVDQLSNNENLIYISSIYFPNKSLLTYLSLVLDQNTYYTSGIATTSIFLNRSTFFSKKKFSKLTKHL